MKTLKTWDHRHYRTFEHLDLAHERKLIACPKCKATQGLPYFRMSLWFVFDIDCYSCGKCFIAKKAADGSDLHKWMYATYVQIEAVLDAEDAEQLRVEQDDEECEDFTFKRYIG